MKKLKFRYFMQLDFDSEITNHRFTLKCIPKTDERQKISNLKVKVYPNEFISRDSDSFGNICIYGQAEDLHDLFYIEVTGEAETGLNKNQSEKEEYYIGYYKYQTSYTMPGLSILGFYNEISKEENLSNIEKAKKYMHKLYEKFQYVQGATNINTTAEEAFALGKGVCQDYAHILLSLLRIDHIPCRYIVGMMTGEGLSHAWVEVYQDKKWIALDPTNNLIVGDEHIKISNGRDYKDCMINQGIFIGNATQKQHISVNVEEYQRQMEENSVIKTIAKAELPVDEVLEIKKHRLQSENGINKKRISIVTGIHGDELEGQFVCYEIIRRIKNNMEYLQGIVDIYPALNPFGIDSITRGIPAFDLDMNRIFPGRKDGDMNEYLASEIVKDLLGSDLCLDIHASNIFLTEIPQIRINELHKETLVPLAKLSNVDFIWVHGASTVLESTFAYTLNSREVPTLVVEMGVGMRITKEYGNQLVDGIFSLMKEKGIWSGLVNEVCKPVISDNNDDVLFLNAPVSGIFIKDKNHGTLVKKEEHVGSIINPLTGELLADILAPESGWLFTTREYPVVNEGSLIGRILKQDVYDRFRG